MKAAVRSDPAVQEAEVDEVHRAVLEAIREVQFGEVTVTVHDGVVVQIDRTERRRLGHPKR
jgi:hypothetical protein